MLAQFRLLAKSPVAKVLLAILVASFLLWGIRGAVQSGVSHDVVIQAGGRPPVTSNLFKQRFGFFKHQLEERAGQTLTTQDAVAHNFDRRVADELGLSESFAELVSRLGVRPSDKLIADVIHKAPQFFNPISGVFDRNAYFQWLGQRGMTAAQAEGELTDEIAQSQFVSGMESGLEPPLIYAAVQAAYLGETRSFDWFELPLSAAGPPIKPTDAQLAAFIKQNAAQLTKPETRQLSAVHISAAALAPGLTISDADLQKRFDFEKDTLSAPEKRSLVQIPARNAAQAATIAQQLRTGVDPAVVAKGLGVQPVTYADQPKVAVADKTVADTAFAMKAGEVSGPVKGDLGLSVLKLTAITPGHMASLQDSRAKLEAEERQKQARNKAYDAVQKYEDVHSGGSDMAGSAKAAGQTVASIGPVTSAGQDANRQPSGLPPKVLQTAFATGQGADSEVQDLGDGEYWIVHVDKVIPPALPSVDEIRPALTRAMISRDLSAKLQAKADALVAQLGASGPKAMTIQAAAAGAGAQLRSAEAVGRSNNPAFSADLLGRVFAAKPGAAVVGAGAGPALVVAKLGKIAPAPTAVLAAATLQQRQSVGRALVEDLAQSVRNAARAKVKPHIDYARARQALGVEAPATPRS